MDIQDLIASLSGGAADVPAPPPMIDEPAPLPSAPSPLAANIPAQIPNAAPTAIPHGQPAASGGGAGIAEHLQDMLPMLIAGLMSGAAMKNPGPYGRSADVGALAEGLLHGYHTSKQGQLAEGQQRLAERRMAIEEGRQAQDVLDKQTDRNLRTGEQHQRHLETSATFVENAVKGAEQFKDDPVAWASYANMMDGIGAKVFGLTKGTISSQLAYPDAARGKKLQKDAAARVEQLQKVYGPEKLFTDEVLDATTQFDGKTVKVRDLLSLAELSIAKPGAAPAGDVGPQLPGGATPALVTPQEKTGDDFDKYLKTTYMPDKKIVGRAPTRAEVLDARKEWQAAGSTADPEMRGLTRELARARLDDMKKKSAGVGDILPGTSDYRLAENLAFGKMTLAQARGLYSGREANGKEKLRAVLDKAEQINPDFNAALFEQGYHFSSSPKTQMAMVALDRVEPNIDKLIELSDKWDRTKYPTVNAFLRAAKFQVGNRVVSDMGQLQTIVGDELGPALGVGAATDLKTKLGLEMAGGDKGPEAFRSSLQLVKDALANQRRALLGRMGEYGKPENQPAAPAGSTNPVVPGKKNPFRP